MQAVTTIGLDFAKCVPISDLQGIPRSGAAR